MARCEGTTRNGDQCKRDARPDSKFCYTHGAAEAESDATVEDEQSEVILEWEDIKPLILVGAMAAGFFLFMRTVGRWIPRM
jgi:hypothetical protein